MDQEKLRVCVHCGLCLEACPTYRIFKNEADSPRGRIALMRGVSDGRIQMTGTVLQHLDACLDCRACETACPAGVPYGELIEEGRAELYPLVPGFARASRLKKWALTRILPNRALLKFFSTLLRFYQKSGLRKLARSSGVMKILPPWMEKGEQLLPEIPPSRAPRRALRAAPPKARAALFLGCIASVAFPEVEAATIEVLEALGAEVAVPERQTCCGALLLHGGFKDETKRLAQINLEAFLSREYDFLVVTAAGCGSTLKEYAKLLPGAPGGPVFCERVLDFSEAVTRLGLPGEMKPVKLRVAYQDACHLLHAQKIASQPRNILKAIPSLELIDIPHGDRCCGSAGIYNLTHPENSEKLLEEKVEAILSASPDVVAVGNPGCSLQIRAGLKKAGKAIPVLHPAELLLRSLRAD